MSPMDEKDLQEFLIKHGCEAKILPQKVETTTVDQARKALGVPKRDIIKTIMFINESGEPILAIVSGDRRVDVEKLAKVVEAAKLRIALPDEVKEHSGYVAGGLPPIGHKKAMKTVVDERVFESEFVYGGGGTTRHLMKIKPSEIRRVQRAIVARISA